MYALFLLFLIFHFYKKFILYHSIERFSFLIIQFILLLKSYWIFLSFSYLAIRGTV